MWVSKSRLILVIATSKLGLTWSIWPFLGQKCPLWSLVCQKFDQRSGHAKVGETDLKVIET